MSLILRLPEQKYSVTVNQERTLMLFGDTILGDALRLDPLVECIDFTQPVMTSGVLNELEAVINNPDRYLSQPLQELGTAKNYLGGKLIPVLTTLGNCPGNITSLTPAQFRQGYKQLIFESISKDWPERAEYIGSHVPPEETKDSDAFLIDVPNQKIASYGSFVRYFVDRGIPIPLKIVWVIIERRDIKLLRHLLDHAQVDWRLIGKDQEQIYKWFIDWRYYNHEIFSLLYKNPEFRSGLNPTELLNLGVYADMYLEFFDLLFSDDRTNRNSVFQKVFDLLFSDQSPDDRRTFLMRILDHPDVNPNPHLDDLLVEAIQKGDSELKDKLLTHPKSNIVYRSAR